MYRSLEKKFTVGYFRVKFIHGEIFSSLGVSNEQKCYLFIHCLKYFVRSIFVVSHQRRKLFNVEFFPNYGICMHACIFLTADLHIIHHYNYIIRCNIYIAIASQLPGKLRNLRWGVQQACAYYAFKITPYALEQYYRVLPIM